MYYTKARWMNRKSVVLDAASIVGEAGFVYNTQFSLDYIIWTSMVSQVNTKSTLYGDIKLL
jgi:hypothetical protein